MGKLVEKIEKFNRALFFSLFSAIGILSISLAVLGPEWKGLYKMQSSTQQSEQNNEKIRQLIEDHDVLIGRINKDPNILKHLAPVTLGENPQEPNMPPVEITADKLAQAKAVLAQSDENANAELSKIPPWLERATLARSRIILFAAGAGLILIAFVCFRAKA